MHDIKRPSLAEIEQALDSGKLFAAMSGGRYWQCRRNGRTQTWKRQPNRFRIPVKAGFRTCGEVTERSIVDASGDQTEDFIIKGE